MKLKNGNEQPSGGCVMLCTVTCNIWICLQEIHYVDGHAMYMSPPMDSIQANSKSRLTIYGIIQLCGALLYCWPLLKLIIHISRHFSCAFHFSLSMIVFLNVTAQFARNRAQFHGKSNIKIIKFYFLIVRLNYNWTNISDNRNGNDCQIVIFQSKWIVFSRLTKRKK